MKKNLYVVLALSPLLLLSGCGEKSTPKSTTGRTVANTADWVVKIGDEVIVTAGEFKDKFNQLLEEKPQIKSMLPLMPNLQKDFAKGLGNQEAVARYIADQKIDQKSEYIARKAKMEEAVTQILNAEFFAQAFESKKLTDADVKKFYEENKDTMQGIMTSRGGANTVGVMFEKKADAEAFLDKARAAGRALNLERLAKEMGLGKKVRDFKLVHEQSFGVDPILRTKILAIKSAPALDIVAANDKTFWVIHVTSKEISKYRAFDEIKEDLKNIAEQTEKAKQMQAELDKLTKHYGLEVNEKFFEKLAPQAPAAQPAEQETGAEQPAQQAA
jgi:hypothetical protein